MYWEEVYPKMGELHMRTALEQEGLYAAEFPFVDYGSDLATMADLEKGVRIEKLNNRTPDAGAAKRDESHYTEKYLQEMRPEKYHKVPLEFHGKAYRGYMLYDWIHHRKRGAPTTSQSFKEVVRHQNTPNEHMVKPELIKRSKIGGVRFAVQFMRNIK